MQKQPFPLSEFLEQLASAGLPVSVRDYRRINQVLSSEGQWTITRLQRVLRSLLVYNEEQALIFERQFKQYFQISEQTAQAIDVSRWNAELQELLNQLDEQETISAYSQEQEEAPASPTKEIEPWVKIEPWYQRKLFKIGLAIFLLIAVGVAACLITGKCQQPAEVIETTKPDIVDPELVTEQAEEQPRLDTGTRNYPSSLVITSVEKRTDLLSSILAKWPWLLSIASLFALLFLILRWQKKRPPEQQKVYKVDLTLPDQHFNEANIGGDLPAWLSEADADHLTDLLAYVSSETDSKTLDISASIKASAERSGIPTLRFHKQRSLQNILILEASQSCGRYWNTLPQELIQALQSRGIKLVHGRYQDSPEQFIDQEGQRHHLQDWEELKQQLLLIVFADTQVQQGIFQFDWQEWPDAMLFTWHEKRFWDERELRLLHNQVHLYPADKKHLLEALQQVQSESIVKPLSTTIQQNPVQDLHESDQAFLQRILGKALPWAEACSLYPGGISLAAIEQIRRQHFKDIPRAQIQRFLKLPGSWCSRRVLEFSPRMLIALRHSFSKRDQQWQQQMIETWERLLDAVEPKNPKTLQWQSWQAKKLRLKMHQDNERYLQELYNLYQSSPTLQKAIQAELIRGDVNNNPNAIPMAMPENLQSKKQLYAMTEGKAGISKTQAWPSARWQLAGAILSGILAVGAVGLGVWQQNQSPALMIDAANSEDLLARTQWESTSAGYQLHLLNVGQNISPLKGNITQNPETAMVRLGTESQERDCQKLLQMAGDNQAQIMQYRCTPNSTAQKPTSWKQAVQELENVPLPDNRQLSIGVVLKKADLDSDNAIASYELIDQLLAQSSVDWLLEVSLSEAQEEIDWKDIDTILFDQLGQWGSRTQVLIMQHESLLNGLLPLEIGGRKFLSLEGDFKVINKIFSDHTQEYLNEENINAKQGLSRVEMVGDSPSAIFPVAKSEALVTNEDDKSNKEEQQPKALPLPDMQTIAAGSFQMGCVSGKGCMDREKPVHEVQIQAFEIGKYEVTNQQYVAFLNDVKKRGTEKEPWFRTKKENDRSHIIQENEQYSTEAGYEQHPVIYMSWYGAKAYLQWLSEQTGHDYRLPTEAEWEYAARAGTQTPYSTGECINTKQANYDGDSGWEECPKTGVYKGDTTAVGRYQQPNAFGLHDVHGNVYEWVEDCYHETYQQAPNDGKAWVENCDRESRVLRGGSWYDGPLWLRSADRGLNTPDGRFYSVGFRAARTIKKPKIDVLLPTMQDILAGEFQMGCVSGKDCQDDEKPVHKVTVPAFKLSQYEITNAQYAQFLNRAKPSVEDRKRWFDLQSEDGRSRILQKDGGYQVQKDYAQHPVNNVSWHGAKAYLQWLSEQTGDTWRLPSEAEWEYAARAGTTTPYSTGECINTDQANYNGEYGWLDCPKTNSYRKDTIEVGQFKPNPFGLNDMHGNLREWTEDCWHGNYENAPVDASPWVEKECGGRVLRGGSWVSEPSRLRSADRNYYSPGERFYFVGFRAARTR